MRKIAPLILIILLLAPIFKAQADDTNDPLKELIIQNLDSISSSLAQPVTKIISTAITGGMYRSAATHSVLGFDIGARVMAVRIPSGKSQIFDAAKQNIFPVPVIQASVGLPMNFEVSARYFAIKIQGADVSLFGVGLKKDFKDLIPIPMFPNVAVMVGYNKFKAGYTNFTLNNISGYFGIPQVVDVEIDAADLISSSHLTYGVIVSKKLSLVVASIQPYAGFTLDHSTMKYKWTGTITNAPDSVYVGESHQTKTEVSLNTSRLTLGVDISPVPFVHLFGDYSFAEYAQFTAGLTLSIR